MGWDIDILGPFGRPATKLALFATNTGFRWTQNVSRACISGTERAKPQAVCMASVHTIEEKEYANSLGFRTFRTGNAGSGDILCPSETGISCAQCKLCCGSSKKAKDIYIPAHGPAAKKVDAISTLGAM